MGENKKEAIANLNREQILKAAEKLFYEKGYEQTTIEDISKLSGYSRRTLYAYYESKEDLLYHIVEKGLLSLQGELTTALAQQTDFLVRYRAICEAMIRYQREYPYGAERVNLAKTKKFAKGEEVPKTVRHILELGTQINEVLASFVEQGKESGVVRKEVVPMLTVYVLWSSMTSLLTLVDTKGTYIGTQFSMTREELLAYGFRQIINAILVERI